MMLVTKRWKKWPGYDNESNDQSKEKDCMGSDDANNDET